MARKQPNPPPPGPHRLPRELPPAPPRRRDEWAVMDALNRLANAAHHVEFARAIKPASLPAAIRYYDELAAKLRKLVTGEDKDVHATAHSVH